MGQVADPSSSGGNASAPAITQSPAGMPSINPPTAVQLTMSINGLTMLNNSTPATALEFRVSGLTTTPAGDMLDVILYADGTQIGAATVSGSSALVKTNGTTRLANGIHHITAVEKLISGGSSGKSVTSGLSPADSIDVRAAVLGPLSGF